MNLSINKYIYLCKLTSLTQVWVLKGLVWFVVLSSLVTKFVLKIIWILVQWLGPTSPMIWCVFMC